MGDEVENRDNDKNQTVGKDDKTVTFVKKERQRDDNRASVTGRPNINEISKRNEEAAQQETKSFYKIAVIILLLVMAAMYLVYFFS